MDVLCAGLLVGIISCLSIISKKMDDTTREILKELKNLNDVLKNDH